MNIYKKIEITILGIVKVIAYLFLTIGTISLAAFLIATIHLVFTSTGYISDITATKSDQLFVLQGFFASAVVVLFSAVTYEKMDTVLRRLK